MKWFVSEKTARKNGKQCWLSSGMLKMVRKLKKRRMSVRLLRDAARFVVTIPRYVGGLEKQGILTYVDEQRSAS